MLLIPFGKSVGQLHRYDGTTIGFGVLSKYISTCGQEQQVNKS